MNTIVSSSFLSDRLLRVAMGTAQALLACVFAAMAIMKLAVHPARLVEIMAWSSGLPLWLVRGLGVCELLAAIAVALPAVTRAPQRIVGIAATFFAALMSSAAIIHLARGEFRMIAVNIAIGAVAVFVAWGRLTHEPLEASEAR